MSEAKRIRVQLRHAYRGPAWHGPAIRELLDGVDAATAAAHPIPGAHSIWELVLHLTYWRRAAVRALDGVPLDLNPPEEEAFPPVGDAGEDAWARALEGLEETQTALLAALKGMDDARLFERVGGREYDLYFLLHGILQHDLYHGGQIALLKKG